MLGVNCVAWDPPGLCSLTTRFLSASLATPGSDFSPAPIYPTDLCFSVSLRISAHWVGLLVAFGAIYSLQSGI